MLEDFVILSRDTAAAKYHAASAWLRAMLHALASVVRTVSKLRGLFIPEAIVMHVLLLAAQVPRCVRASDACGGLRASLAGGASVAAA